MLERYYRQTKVCPECKKEVLMRDWPVMPSTGQPKRTCCLVAGWNNKRKYEGRRKLVGDVEHWLCSSCKNHKPTDRFYLSKGHVSAICKDCHSKKYRNYKSDKRKRESLEAKKRKIARENELITCRRCQRSIKRKYWPITKNGQKSEICCSERTTAQINRALRKKGKKFCGSCNKVFEHSEFWTRSDGKIISPCKNCRKINGIKSGSREKRHKEILSTDDGTLSKEVVRNLFIAQKLCLVCEKPMEFSDKTMDHIVPLSRGGAHSLENVMVMCSLCNSKKHARAASEWFSELSEEQKQRILAQEHINKEVFK